MDLDVYGVTFTPAGWSLLTAYPTWSLQAMFHLLSESELLRRQKADRTLLYKDFVSLYLRDPHGIHYDLHFSSLHCTFDDMSVAGSKSCSVHIYSTLAGTSGHTILASVEDLVSQYLAVQKVLASSPEKKAIKPVKYI